MKRRQLLVADHHDLLGIWLHGLRVGRESVSQRKDREPARLEVAGVEVGDVPAKTLDAELIPLVAEPAPVFGRPEREKRQREMVLGEEVSRFPYITIESRSSHGISLESGTPRRL